jgi:hypothetical protein
MLEKLRAENNPARQQLEQLRQQRSAQELEGVDTTPFEIPMAKASPSVGGTGGLRETTPQPLKLAPEIQTAAQSGVDVLSGAPTGRAFAGFAQNQALQAQELEKALTEHYGKSVRVRVGPQSKQLEFLNPETNRFTLVDEAKVSLRDIQEMAGPAITMGGAVAGELIAGPPGAAAGAAVGEGVRRAIGTAAGVRDETAEETVKGVAGVAAIEGVASGAGHLVARAAQGARNLVRPAAVSPSEAQRLLSASEAAQSVADEISARTGQPLRPFTGQMAEDPALIGEQQRILSSRQTGVEARRQLAQNETTLEAFFDQVTPGDAGPLTATGRAIQTEAREQTQPRIEAISDGVQRQISDLEGMTSALPRAQNQQIGNQLRELAYTQRVALKEVEDRAWDSVRRGMGVNPETSLSQYQVPVSGDLEKTLLQLRAEAQQALDPATSAGKRQLATERLLPDPEDLSDDDLELLRTFGMSVDDQQHTVDLNQVQVLLQSLRKRERISRQGVVATDPAGRDISRLRDALVTQRNTYLREVDPELLIELEAAEALTATRARLFDKGLVGGILRRIDGEYAITDSEVVGRTIGSGDPEAIQHLVSVLSTHPAGVPTLQNSMLAVYRNEVIRDGVPRGELHRRFIERHGEALNALFPGEKKILELGEFEKVVTRNVKRFEDLEKGVQRSFRGKIQDLAPERIAENALSNSFSVKDVSRLMSLADAAGMKDQYQRAVGDMIRRRYVSNTGGINFNTLEKFVGKESERLSAVFGPGYVRDMRLLLKGLSTVRTTAGGIATTRNPTLMEALARTTVARPLSPGGVALTRFLGYRQRAGERMIAEAIMSPQGLHAIIQQGQTDIADRKIAQLLAVMGASSLAIEANEGE